MDGCYSSPKTLGVDDIEKMKSSNKHLARKIDMDFDSKIISELRSYIESSEI